MNMLANKIMGSLAIFVEIPNFGLIVCNIGTGIR